MATTFCFAGNNDYQNRGCEAIVRGTTEILRAEFGESFFYSCIYSAQKDFKGIDAFDSQVFNIPFRDITPKSPLNWFAHNLLHKFHPNPDQAKYFQFQECKEAMQKSQAVLMLGGDNYSLDYGDPKWYFNLDDFALKYNPVVAIWGASIGPFSKDPQYEVLAAEKLKKVTRIYARETATFDYLKSIGVEENVRLTADPAFCMVPASVELPQDLEKFLKNGCIGLNLSPLLRKFYMQNADFSSWVKAAADVIEGVLREIDYPLLLIPHVMRGQNIAINDYIFLKAALEQISDAGLKQKVYLLEPIYNAAQKKWIISHLIAFAGARTHATIAAISSGVPTICIAYSIKARGIVNDVYGDERWLLESNHLSAESLVRKFKEILQTQDEVRTNLTAAVPLLQQKASSAAKDLREIISERK